MSTSAKVFAGIALGLALLLSATSLTLTLIDAGPRGPQGPAGPAGSAGVKPTMIDALKADIKTLTGCLNEAVTVAQSMRAKGDISLPASVTNADLFSNTLTGSAEGPVSLKVKPSVLLSGPCEQLMKQKK